MVGLCPLVYRTTMTVVRGCADLGVGTIRSAGHGFASNSGQESPIVQALVAGRVTRRLVGPLEIGVGLGLVVPFTHPKFVYGDASNSDQALFQVAPVGALLDAGIGLAFP
jgi:hypothetical protein